MVHVVKTCLGRGTDPSFLAWTITGDTRWFGEDEANSAIIV